jgi:hypothetical protein
VVAALPCDPCRGRGVHLNDCGCRHHAEQAAFFAVPPRSDAISWWLADIDRQDHVDHAPRRSREEADRVVLIEDTRDCNARRQTLWPCEPRMASPHYPISSGRRCDCGRINPDW